MKVLEKKFNIKNKNVFFITDDEEWLKNYKEQFFEFKINLFIVLLKVTNKEFSYKVDLLKKNKINNYQVNVLNEKIVQKILNHFALKNKKIDILINKFNHNKLRINLTKFNRPENYSIKNFKNNISLFLNSIFVSCKYFGNKMIRNKNGIIVNILNENNLSVDKKKLVPPEISIANEGIINFSRYLSTHWADKNIRVNCIIENSQSKQASFGSLLFLISSASSYMTGNIIDLNK